MTSPAAWHPDPFGEASWRWWDGSAWSGRVAPAREAPELAALSSVAGRSLRLDQQFGAAREQVVNPADYDPAHAGWVWYGADRIPLATVRLSSPPPRTKRIFGREIEYTTSSSGTGKTGMDIWTDLHRPSASVGELPLLTLLGTFLIWWTTSMRESVHRGRM